MNIEWITTSDNRVIGAQVKTHFITRPTNETEQDFVKRVKLFAENLERLKAGGAK